MITVERAAYLVIGLLAAVLRFYQLGLRPLSEAEASQALAAYRFTQNASQVAPAGTIPALFTGNVVGFSLLGASDITARWLPALAGLVLVLLPYWLRHRLGRGGALAAAVLLALSPSAIYFSRNVDGAILATACGLAMAVGLINYLDTRRPSYLYLATAAMGLGLCADPGTITLALIFAAFALLLYLTERLQNRETGWSSLLVAWWAVRDETSLLTRIGAVLGAVFGLVATTFVLHLAGLGHTADLLAAWLWSFAPGTSIRAVNYPILLLVRYEPLILLLGLVGARRGLRGRRSDSQGSPRHGSLFPHTVFLVFWTAVAMIVFLLSGYRLVGNILWVVVPLALLAGQGVEHAWQWVTRRALWKESIAIAAVALGLGIFFYLQIAAYGLTDEVSTVSFVGLTLYTSSAYWLLASVALMLLVGLGAVVWAWRGAQPVVGGGWLAALVILGLWGFKATWGLNVAYAADPRELMIVQTTAPDVRVLAAELEELSANKAGDAHTLPITVDAATGPVVAWYLREFDQQTTVDDLSTSPDTAAAVTLAEQDLPIGETFRGRGFPLRLSGTPWDLRGQSLIRWLLFNKGYYPVVDQEVVLWVESKP
ncbi:MAG: TIGR03663 family protein [Anaerolineae bacterium]|jgi:uncharacterized protein (TIGR03663 family)